MASTATYDLEKPSLFKKKKKKDSYSANLAGYVFISPWLVGFLLLPYGQLVNRSLSTSRTTLY